MTRKSKPPKYPEKFLRQVGPEAITSVAQIRVLLQAPFEVVEDTDGFVAVWKGETIAHGSTPERAWISGTRLLLNKMSDLVGVAPWFTLPAPPKD